MARLADLARGWLDANAEALRRELAQRVAELERVGRAPSLFTLMGIEAYERPYNRVLAWMVDPAAPHGAGRAVLHELARRLDAAPLLADLADPDVPIEVRAEDVWPEAAGSTTQPDLLVLTPSYALLIENKVRAGESGPDQYEEYGRALQRLADARRVASGAWLAAPEARPTPGHDRRGIPWAGSIRHVDLAEVLRAAADAPDVSAWGRITCLLVAAQLAEPDGHHPPLDQARRILARAGRAPGEAAEIRGLLPRLPSHSPPWRDPASSTIPGARRSPPSTASSRSSKRYAPSTTPSSRRGTPRRSTPSARRSRAGRPQR